MYPWINKNDGFTLIEILVSLAIFSMVIIPFSSLLLSTAKINHYSRKTILATHLAQSYMEKLKTPGTIELGRQERIDEDTGLIVYTNVCSYKPEKYMLSTGYEEDQLSTALLYKLEVIIKDSYSKKEITKLVSLKKIN
jgi:prepilin-type N-terminal cleavage/methylation domain-containing protein